MAISTSDQKALCLASGGICAFPDCGDLLVTYAANGDPIVLGEIAHIIAVSPTGPRGDCGSTEEERNRLSNLILLCSKHHTIVDADTTKYTVDILRGMKAEHEARVAATVPTSVAGRLQPKVLREVKVLLDAGWAYRIAAQYQEARDAFENALSLAREQEHKYSVAEATYCVAFLLVERHENLPHAEVLLRECLSTFREMNSEGDIASVLEQLSLIELDSHHFDQAFAYASQALELHRRSAKTAGVANCLRDLAWIEHGRGLMDQALRLYEDALAKYMELYNAGSDADPDNIIGVAACYAHLGMLHEGMGNVTEAESSFLRSLDWFRRTSFRPDTAKVLTRLAEVKFRETEYEVGMQYLDEAIRTYADLRDHAWLARCLDLKARLHFTLGDRPAAKTLLETALEHLQLAGDDDEMEKCLSKLGQVFQGEGDLQKASEYFRQQLELSRRIDSLDGIAHAVESLAEIAVAQNDTARRDQLLTEGIGATKDLLRRVETDRERASLTGQIGAYYEKMGKLNEALTYYENSRRRYEKLGNIGMRGLAITSIARIQGMLGRRDLEFNLYREAKSLVDGSPFYDLIAGTAINLGVFEMHSGRLVEAKRWFDEAEFYCTKYNLPFQRELNLNREQLLIEHKKVAPPKLTFSQLVDDLFNLLNWSPDAPREALLRFWFFDRGPELYAECRTVPRLRLMVAEDDVARFLSLAAHLGPYSDFAFQAVSSPFRETVTDQFLYPVDRGFSTSFSFAAIRKDGRSQSKTKGGPFEVRRLRHSEPTRRYIVFLGTRLQSNLTGREGVFVLGWSQGLPKQAYELILSHTAEELVTKRVFFLPYERSLASARLLGDIKMARQLGMVPVYAGELPAQDGVRVLASEVAEMPIGVECDEGFRAQATRIKEQFLQITSSTRESIAPRMKEVADRIRHLCEPVRSRQTVPIRLFACCPEDQSENVVLVILCISTHGVVARDGALSSI